MSFGSQNPIPSGWLKMMKSLSDFTLIAYSSTTARYGKFDLETIFDKSYMISEQTNLELKNIHTKKWHLNPDPIGNISQNLGVHCVWNLDREYNAYAVRCQNDYVVSINIGLLLLLETT